MATVLVALAWTGKTPMPSMAGKDKSEPPPATALRAPARNPATISQTHRQSTFEINAEVEINAELCAIPLHCRGSRPDSASWEEPEPEVEGEDWGVVGRRSGAIWSGFSGLEGREASETGFWL